MEVQTGTGLFSHLSGKISKYQMKYANLDKF